MKLSIEIGCLQQKLDFDLQRYEKHGLLPSAAQSGITAHRNSVFDTKKLKLKYFIEL